MAAAHDQSPVGPSPLRSPSTSQRSTRTFSSEGEDAGGETESPKEGPSCSEEDEFPGENGSVEHGPEEDGSPEGEEVPRRGDSLYPHGHLCEEQHREWRENLPRGGGPRERDDLYDNDALEGGE